MKLPRKVKDYLGTQFPLTAPVRRYLKGRRLKKLGREAVFREMFNKNLWGGDESVSGPGSGARETGSIRRELPGLLEQLGVRVMLDAPCGDHFWMNLINLPVERYIGVDIVPELIALNRGQYGSDNVSFICLDLTEDELPAADLILCRDCFIHLSYEDIDKALGNFARSGASYLLTTTFSGHDANVDIATGLWRPINLEASPISLPPPILVISENKPSRWRGSHIEKYLALWRMDDIPTDHPARAADSRARFAGGPRR